MNSTTPPPEQNLGRFPIIFGASIGSLSLIAIILLTVYLCTRRRPSLPDPSSHDGVSASSDDQDLSSSVTINIEATLNTYPKILFSDAKNEKGDSSIASSCSICLAEYSDSDVLRLLPDCDHLFHVQCVDQWLKLHPTCPICRNSSRRTQSNLTPQSNPSQTTQPFFDPFFVRLMY
ncbi:hypothetical protein P3X46_025186 [Hevea brasiliensis]|uniref:RING-type domain-containing protein n=1 Tax=Hevea brasiliensis TaxID=3981 RepID=A0ABQ9L871_HEVBR|nr:RING-H2 finger protein ATL70-like [Hevea brasiliensis]KAJ9159707.1 hypothetical protein P3X46_025186 [Hevea brasiliensis]